MSLVSAVEGMRVGGGSPPALRQRDRQRLETRRRIFEAAIAEIRRVGFANAQVARIAEAAGVAHGTFFFHFPTKDHVLLEMQDQGERRVVERLRGTHHRSRSVAGFLMQVVDAILAEEVISGTELMRELLGVHARQPGILGAPSTPLAAALVQFFAEAARQGEIRADLKPEELTGMFSAMIFGLLLRGTVETPRWRRPLLKRAIDLFARGITTRTRE